VEAYLGLVRTVATRYRDLGLPFDDLVQEGSIGLLEAIDRFDPARGAPFESYARFRVRRAILNALTSQARLIRLPKHIVERRRAIDQAEARLGGPGVASLARVAAATGLSVAAVVEARHATAPPVSLDEPLLPGGAPLEALVADPAAGDPGLQVVEHEQEELLAQALQTLSERQRHVVSRQWGLGGREAASGSELAEELEVSPRRTQTIGRDALYRLRQALELPEVAA
jgi:RNA polymerase primary sigma factor